MSRWLSNKDSVLQAKKISFQVIFRPREPLFPWAAGLPWGVFPGVVRELLEWAHARGMLTEDGLMLDRMGGDRPSPCAREVTLPSLAMDAGLIPKQTPQPSEPAPAEPFVIRRYQGR